MTESGTWRKSVIGLAATLFVTVGWVLVRPEGPAPARAPASPETNDSAPARPERRSGPGAKRSWRGRALEARRWLRVVDATSGRPVPGATVRFGVLGALDELDPDRWRAAQELRRRDVEEFLRVHGASSTADPDGWLVSTREPGWPRTARLGSRYGEADPDGSGDIAIAPDRSLRVRVLDVEGAPVSGIDVALGIDRSSDVPPGGLNASVAVTNEAGEASLPHVGLLAARARGHGVGTLLLAPGIAGSASVGLGLVIRPPAWPSEPVVLRLPACRTVIVTLRGPDGTRFPMSGRGDEFVSLRVETTPQGYDTADLVGGVARFARVPLGVGLTLSAHVAGFEAERRLPPSTGRAMAEYVELQLRSSAPVYAVRAVGADRQPLADRLLSVAVPGFVASLRRRTDAAGRLLVPLPRDEDNDFEDAVLRLTTLALRHDTNGRELAPELGTERAAVRLPPAAHGSVTELGDVALLPLPLLASGVIHAAPSALADDWSRHAIATGIAVDELRLTEQGRSWHRREDVVVRVAPTGAFAVHGSRGRAALRLRDVRRRVAPFAPVPFVPGAAGLELQLPTPGSLEIDVVPAARDELALQLEPLDRCWPEHDSRDLRRVRPSSRVRRPERPHRDVHVLPWLWPGSYRVSAHLRGLAAPLTILDRVEIRAGERTRPWLSSPLDPAAVARRVDVQLADASRRSSSRATLRLWVRDPTPRAISLAAGNRQCWLPFTVDEGVLDVRGRCLTIWRPEAQPVAVPSLFEVELRLPADVTSARLEVVRDHPLYSWRDVPQLRTALRLDVVRGTQRVRCRAPGPWVLTLARGGGQPTSVDVVLAPAHAGRVLDLTSTAPTLRVSSGQVGRS